MATARWVFPTPGLPTSRTFSARSMNPRVEISSRSGRGTDGWNVQSESASVFTHGRPEECILSLVILSVLAPASTWVISVTARARSAPPPSATVTRICPPSIDTALAFLPMHPRGTDCCLPASLTSIVGGTTCSVTSPMLMCNRNWF